jgi:hypothetical protein
MVVWLSGDLDFLEWDPASALGFRDPGTNRAVYPRCIQEIETARKEEAIGCGRLFEAKIVVEGTFACRRSPVHTLYLGREAFASGVDIRVSDCVDVHILGLQVPRYQPADASDFVVASVDVLRILERVIGLVVRLADNFLPRGGRQI